MGTWFEGIDWWKVLAIGFAALGWVLAIIQLIYRQKTGHYETYKFCSGQALAVKLDHIQTPELLETTLLGEGSRSYAHFRNVVPTGMEPRVFLAICSHFYRYESIWVARREKQLPDNMWESLRREMELYLNSPAFWEVFFKHSARDSGLLDDFTKAVAHFYLATDQSPHSLPDPIKSSRDFKSWPWTSIKKEKLKMDQVVLSDEEVQELIREHRRAPYEQTSARVQGS